MGVGATGILKCARSPAGAGGGRVAVTLHRKPPGGWSGRVGLGRKGVLEEETASAQPAGVARQLSDQAYTCAKKLKACRQNDTPYFYYWRKCL